MLIKFLLLLFSLLARATSLWTLHNSTSGETIMKTILDSCYKNSDSSNPILIFGDSNGFIVESAIMQMNNSFNFTENYEHDKEQLLDFRASKMIFIHDSSKDSFWKLELLQQTRWWNHMAPLFIIEKTGETCKNFLDILMRIKRVNTIAPIYICESKEKMVLFTSNPIANYAPYPWRRIRGIHNVNVFRQVFDINISCDNLHYDRTKFLNGYEIKLVGALPPIYGYKRGRDYCKKLPNPHEVGFRSLLTLIRELNATCRLEYEQEYNLASDRVYNCEMDMYRDAKVPERIQLDRIQHLFAAFQSDLIAVVKSNPEMSTLQKLLHLWSSLVLYLAALVLLILLTILALKNRDFSMAILEMVRFLTYNSIETTCRRHSFRIYFTTMLIFIVISNGVFQGKIAAFLSTLEKMKMVETIDELIELKYTFYTSPGNEQSILRFYPNADVKEVVMEDCINLVMNQTLSVCVIDRQFYEEKWALFPVETVEIPSSKNLEYYETRPNWPLLNRVNSKLMAMSEAGLIKFWRTEYSSTPMKKKEAERIELSSSHYRPIKLYKLNFAFHLLAIGLMMSVIAFLVEFMAFAVFKH